MLLFVVIISSAAHASWKLAVDDKGVKDPYSLSLQAFGGNTVTDVYLTILTVDARLYPLPTSTKQVNIKLKDKVKGLDFDKYDTDNVSLVNGQAVIRLNAVLSSYDLEVRVHLNPDVSHDVNLRETVTVLQRPDLRVASMVAPTQVASRTPFGITGVIKEFGGQSGAAATVTLYDGSTIVGTPQAVTVTAGGSTNVAFNGISTAVSGMHTYTLKISNSNPAESDETNNSFSVTTNVTAVPDLQVVQVLSPAQITANTPFNVQGVIRELTGQSAVTASASLYENTNLLATQSNFVVPAGGTLTVTFTGITETIPGTHTFSVVVTALSPTESNLSNNQNVGATSVIQLIPLQLDVTYQYQKTNSWSIAISSGPNKSDTTFSEMDILTCSASSAGGLFPTSPITSVSWTVSSPAGTFDAGGASNLTLVSSDATNDYYGATTPDNKGVVLNLTVNRITGTILAALTHQATYTRVIDVFYATTISVSGDPAAIIRPSGSLSMSLSLQSGENTWGGSSTIPVSPLTLITETPNHFTASGSPDPDTGIQPGEWSGFWMYRAAGPGAPSTTTGANVRPVAVNEEQPSPTLPQTFGLQQNYPNPFNPSTTIEFSLPKASYVSVKVYDMLAREVATVVSREYAAGVYRLRWDAKALPSGAYIYRITTGDFTAQRKLILMK